MNTKQLAHTIICVIFLQFNAGCTDDKPSTADAHKAAKAQLNSRLAEIQSFKRLNGSESTSKGRKTYDVDVRLKVKFLDDVHYSSPFLDVEEGHTSIQVMHKNYNKGDVITHDATILFIKTENGWVSEGCIIR